MALRSTVVYPGANKRKGGYSDEFYTPDYIVRSLGWFDLDPCAGPKNHARRNIRAPECGLSKPWAGRVWLNPPYSSLHHWLERFIEHGNGIILVNARPETNWFQNLASKAACLLWLKGRVKFESPVGKTNSPPVGSVLVAIGEKNKTSLQKSKLRGLLMTIDHGPD